MSNFVCTVLDKLNDKNCHTNLKRLALQKILYAL